MQSNPHFRLFIVSALLLAHWQTAADGPNYRVTERFVPLTSDFTQRYGGAGASAAPTSFDLSPDGKALAVEFSTGGRQDIGRWVALWDVDRAHLIGAKQVDSNIPYVAWYINNIRFSPDGRKLIALTGPRLVALSVPDLKILYAFEDRVQLQDAPNQMFIEGFSIASNRLAILRQYDYNSGHSYSLEVQIADLDSGKVLARWGWPRLCYSIAMSPDAILLALAIPQGRWGDRDISAKQSNVFIVKPDTGQVVRDFNSGYAVGDAQFVGGNNVLVTVPLNSDFSPDDAIKVWDIKRARVEQELTYARYGLRGGISVSADSKVLAVAAFWLNAKDIKRDRDNVRGGARLLLWTLHGGKLLYASEQLPQEYNRAGLPMAVSYGRIAPPVLVRMSASGDRLAIGGMLISVDFIVKDQG